MEAMNPVVLLSAGLELYSAAITAVIVVAIIFDERRNIPDNRLLLTMLLVHMAMLLCDGLRWLLLGHPQYRALLILTTLLPYSMYCCIIVLYAYVLILYIRKKADASFLPAHLMAAAGALLILFWCDSLKSGACFHISQSGHFVPGPKYPLALLLRMVLLLGDVAIVLWYHKLLGALYTLFLCLYCLPPIVALPLQRYMNVTPAYVASTISMLIAYGVLHIKRSRLIHEQEQQLNQNRIAIMLSQIQPHFLYNALLVIQGMCHGKAPDAEQSTIEFSEFLRGNMDSLSENRPIPFERELKHTQNYLSLEKKRFGDRLRVEYDLQTTTFCLPALSLQPLVENAVRYGVMQRETGGTVRIATLEDEVSYQVIVTDDGVGFDISKKKMDGRTHIGIDNVRNRLATLCGGKLQVDSRRNYGTTAIITLPKGVPEG